MMSETYQFKIEEGLYEPVIIKKTKQYNIFEMSINGISEKFMLTSEAIDGMIERGEIKK